MMATVVNKLSEVSSKLAEYEAALGKITEKRERWQSETKPLLFHTLKEIQQLAPDDWIINVQDEIENLEEVILKFRKVKSGIVVKHENETISRMKFGGSLVFDQEYNGDICVYISYPHVEESVDHQPQKKLDRVSPDRITEEYITTQVVRLLDEMIRWENSNSKITIGFKWDGG